MSCIVKDSGNFVHMKISPTAYDNQIPSMKSRGQELPGTMRSFFSTLDMSDEHTIDEYAYSPHFLSV
jgi:hypothetical protein